MLTIDSIEYALKKPIVIDKQRISGQLHRYKRFEFTPWYNEYNIYVGKTLVGGGQTLEELLEVYNSY